MIIRQIIKDFLTNNANSSEATILAECEAKGYGSPSRVSMLLAKMVTRGVIVKNGDSYSIAP